MTKEFRSLGLLLSLFLLLINDFLLKMHFGNWLTGKLSDFAGLFLFPLFWSVLFPKVRMHIYLLTAIFFIFWKSELSDGLIILLNQYTFLNLTRVVDFTDLIALSVLPFSFWYSKKPDKKSVSIHPGFVVIVTSFSFMATSYHSEVDNRKEYTFNYPLDTLKKRIYYLKNVENDYEKYYYSNTDSTKKYKIRREYNDTLRAIIVINEYIKDTMALSVIDDFCFTHYKANIILSGDSENSKIQLLDFEYKCPERKDGKDILNKSFEEKVIEELQK